MSSALDDFGPPEPIAKPAKKVKVDPYAAYDAAVEAGNAEGEQYIQEHPELQPKTSGQFIPGRGTVGTGPLAAIGEGLSNPFGVRAKLSALIEPGDYKENLAKERQVGEAIHEAHPVLNTASKMAMELPAYVLAPNTLGAQTAVGAGAGALDTAAGSENVLGEKGTNLRGAGEAAGGAAGGGLGAALGYKIFKGLGNKLGRAADESADLAVTGGTKSAMRALDKAFGPVGGAEAMVPGEKAALLRAADAVGGVRSRAGTTEGLKNAWKSLDEQFGGLIRKAEESGTKVPLTSAAANLNEAASQFMANDAVGPMVAKNLERLGAVADKNGDISHEALQGILKELRPTVSKIYQKTSNFRSPSEEAFLGTYRALRKTQDEGLEAAVGEGAQGVRQYSALMHRLEELSTRANEGLRGNDPVGLLGHIQKAKGSGEVAAGVMALATGHPHIGIPMILKGVLSHTQGAFGKSAAPYKANVLTSLFSKAQQPVAAFSETGVPFILGGKAGEGIGSAAGGALGGALETPASDDFGPPEPIEAAAPLRVARKGK
jgi:hypothetical protein